MLLYDVENKSTGRSRLDILLAKELNVNPSQISRALLGAKIPHRHTSAGVYNKLMAIVDRLPRMAYVREALKRKLREMIDEDIAYFIKEALKYHPVESGNVKSIVKNILEQWPSESKFSLRNREVLKILLNQGLKNPNGIAQKLAVSRMTLYLTLPKAGNELRAVMQTQGMYERFAASLIRLLKLGTFKYLSGRLYTLREDLALPISKIVSGSHLDALQPQDITRLIEMRLYDGRNYAFLGKKFGFPTVTMNRFFEGMKKEKYTEAAGAIEKLKVFMENLITQRFLEQFHAALERGIGGAECIAEAQAKLELLQRKYILRFEEARKDIAFVREHMNNHIRVYANTRYDRESSSPLVEYELPIIDKIVFCTNTKGDETIPVRVMTLEENDLEVL